MRRRDSGQAELQAVGCGIQAILLLVVVILTIVLGGTWRTEVSFSPAPKPQGSTEVPFEETITAHHWLGGLIQGSQPDVHTTMAKYILPGDKITRMTVLTQHTIVNYLLMGVTLCIYAPVSVTVKGTIARPIPGAAEPAAQPPKAAPKAATKAPPKPDVEAPPAKYDK